MRITYRIPYFALVLSLFFGHQLLGQQGSKKIVLHLNKSTFISGESIQYGSYLLDGDSNTLYKGMEYLYVHLLDGQGNPVDDRVTLSTDGLGAGGFILDKEMESGQYYIQAFTARMNIMERDGSAIYPISIINFDSGFLPALSDVSGIKMDIFPEGGNLVAGVFNSCAIQVRDVFNKPLKVDSLLLSNNRETKKQPIAIDENGLGKFSLIPDKDIDFVLTAFLRGKGVSVPVMGPQKIGFVLMASTNHEKKEVAISVRTNEATDRLMGKETVSLLLESDNDTTLLKIPLQLTNQKKELILPYTDLKQGINTIYLLDGNSAVLASRSIFVLKEQYTTLPEITSVKRERDSLTVRIKTSLGGKENFKPVISLSVLPEKSVSRSSLLSINTIDTQNDILPVHNLVRDP